MTTAPKTLHKEYALLLLLAFLWGASYTFIKIGVETIPPITFITCRTFIAGAILLAVIYWRGLRLPMNWSLWSKFLIQAGLNSVVPFTLIAWAETSTDAGLTTILNSTTPIFTFILTALITHHEDISWTKFLGLAAGFVGICLIIGIEALSGIGSEFWAQVAILFATFCYGWAAIFGKNFRGLDPLIPAAGSMICGAVILFPISLVVDHPWTITPSTHSILALLALAVFSTALAFSIYFKLIHTLGSVGVTSVAYLRVPIGVGISIVFLGERLTPTAWIGLACVVAGVIAMTLPNGSLRKSQAEHGG